MKLLLTILFMGVLITHAQVNCVNGISTNPQDPSPSDPNSYKTNKFDWTAGFKLNDAI